MTASLRRLAAPAALALALLAAPRPATAAPKRGAARGSEMLSLWGVLDPGPYDGLGLGGRVMVPLVPEGLLHHPRVRDELTLEFGADFVHYEDRVGVGPYYDYSWNGILPVAGATWNFWLTPRLAAYPKIDLGWWFGWYRGPAAPFPYDRADFDGVFLQGAVGIVYKLQTVALRVEAGSGLLRIGVGLPY